MKKLLSLVLVVLFACTALVACGETAISEEDLLGVWTFKENVKDILGMDLTLEGSFEYKADGKGSMSFEEEGLKAALKELYKDMDVEELAEMSGVSVSEIETMMNSMGMTLDAFKEFIVETGASALGSEKDGFIVIPIYYELDGTTLHMGLDKEISDDMGGTYTYENGEIHLSDMTLKKEK